MRKEAVKTAVSRFVELPTVQRSVVILKDVLDESLIEIAALLDLTVDAVKAHLARGRAHLRWRRRQIPRTTARLSNVRRGIRGRRVIWQVVSVTCIGHTSDLPTPALYTGTRSASTLRSISTPGAQARGALNLILAGGWGVMAGIFICE